MSFLKKKQPEAPAVPKSDETPLVETLMDEVNGYQREMYRRLRTGERPSSPTMVILNHRQSAVLKSLLHDIGVTPVMDHRGFWYLYEGSSQNS
jgi:hypothetical protein